MDLYNRIVELHSESRPSFVLFAEFIAFVGSMAMMVAIGFIRDWLL